MAFKVLEEFLNMRVAFRGVPLLADVEFWDAPYPWLLFGWVVVEVCHTANVSVEPLQGFVDVVGGL